MRKLILYIATSLDGYIASEDGSIDWLDKAPQSEDNYDYESFYDSIDTVLMGNNTFKQIMSFEKSFPYTDKKNYVVSRENNIDSDFSSLVEYVSEDLVDFITNLKKQEGKDIWLVGGSKLNSTLLYNNLIDEIIITKLPIALGAGISLFDSQARNSSFTLIKCKEYETGVLQLHYKKNKN